MAGRPPKESIDYSGWDVSIFDNDPKIDKLIDGQGAAAFTIYFYLCQRAYGSKGYYYVWSYDDSATTARKIGGGIGSDTVRQTVSLCLRIGLFDKRLFEGHGILTSSGIQKRFWEVAKNRNCNTVIKEYWLLDGTGSSNKVMSKSYYTGSKLNYDAPKFNYEKRKESKGKERNKGLQSGGEKSESTDDIIYPAFNEVSMLEEIMANVNTPCLQPEYWAETIPNYLDSMFYAPSIKVSGQVIQQGDVRKRMLELDCENVQFALDKLKTAGEIENIRGYLLACLYNAPADYNAFMNAEVAKLG